MLTRLALVLLAVVGGLTPIESPKRADVVHVFELKRPSQITSPLLKTVCVEETHFISHVELISQAPASGSRRRYLLNRAWLL